tara:strand:+ start:1186 stop:1725 length:540 start_codon:yes stop_codon:yes gene_type:complete
MTRMKDWLVVGKITSPHGIKGKLHVKSLSDFAERFTKPGTRWLQKEEEEPIKFELTSGFQKPGKEIFIISFEGINTRDEAEKLTKQKILVKKNDIPELKDGEFHINELLNLKVKLCIKSEMQIIGEVCDLINENNNLLEVHLFEKDKNILVPFVKEIVTKIDKNNNYIVINPPKGLLDL